MGGEFPPLNTRQVLQILTAAGFSCIRSSGSHFAWSIVSGGMERTVIVKKLPAGDVYRPGTLGSMITQSGVSRRDFYALLR
jgi:predicted RNA binding protein YcfA (HicA-like mRNA interferase family)